MRVRCPFCRAECPRESRCGWPTYCARCLRAGLSVRLVALWPDGTALTPAEEG